MAAVLCVACTGVATVAPGDPQGRLATEFATARPTESTRRGWPEGIFPQADSLQLMRALSSSRGWHLAGVAVLPTGVHPYSVVAFLERDGRFRAIHTAMYWGSVQGKWLVETSQAKGEALLSELRGLFRCSDGRALESNLAGPLLVTWDAAGEQRVCTAERFSDEAALAGRPLEALFAGAEATYSPLE